ncbi:hypothetical protein [Thioalkalivibrio paradoxus]|uniref:Uncharacterized protein n=1 Tax=Thioalkalivibrio paradoxus ARh 1 TaxID=713585 RepID=W0DSJ7_9GAMM|nr:hypothetical protein [Thioalkalivibrio paradoxus]AHE99830.1 hypothetical protein THITH_01210 [Thioalkalivibrio paradoxus ARh 1]
MFRWFHDRSVRMLERARARVAGPALIVHPGVAVHDNEALALLEHPTG